VLRRISSTILLVCSPLLLVGCVTYPVGQTPQYKPYLNNQYVLRQNCTLWKTGFLPRYVLTAQWNPGSTWEGMARVAEIPKGTLVTVKGVLRKRYGLMENWHFYDDSASLSVHRESRAVRASLKAGSNWGNQSNWGDQVVTLPEFLVADPAALSQ
jgi:hypothetical protein